MVMRLRSLGTFLQAATAAALRVSQHCIDVQRRPEQTGKAIELTRKSSERYACIRTVVQVLPQLLAAPAVPHLRAVQL
jgi:hypothetical protein